jgi:Thiamine pyrophosphate-requiring enzymes [acetolactate synthase, pyruvate dehydrogenase (cytochrome), glyoxylate carboligase, phosphonopyruvate decarboxylase]
VTRQQAGLAKQCNDAAAVVENAAEQLVSVLMTHGVDLIFLNPGTDTAPVQEALARLAAKGFQPPRIIICPHEAVALAAAHAYFAVTGRPQVVMVHVDVGTQNLGAMLHNASRANAGVVIIAGRTPNTAYGEQPGGRDLVVHWQQDVPDQTGIVRSYVKWAGDLVGADTLARQLGRAFQIARSAPAGPVYLTVAREVLMQPMEPSADGSLAVNRFGAPAPAAPNPGALRDAAEILARSTHPVIITSRAGRDREAVPELVRLAELLGAAVVDRRERLNFPSDHPCYVADAAEGQAVLGRADAVLVIDCDVPWIPLRATPPEAATIIQMDADPVKASIPGWSFPVDLAIQTDPVVGLRALIDALETREGTDASLPWEQRRRAVRSRPPWKSSDTSASRAEPAAGLTPDAVVAALDEALAPEDIVVDEAVTNTEVLKRGLRRTLPGTVYQSGGSGLGWAVAAAMGTKLAAPGRRVVAIVGDGTFMFSSPTAALWAAHDAQAPILVVILANGGYAASRRPVFELYPDGTSALNGDVVGTRFQDAPDFAKLADACHAHGEHIYDEDQLKPTLARCFELLDEGRSAVLTCHVSSPWL